MIFQWVAFIVFLSLSFWFVPKFSLIRHASLTLSETRFLLAFKIITSLLCAFYFKSFSTNVDYLANNAEGNLQYQLLLSKPTLFFTDFKTDINTYGLGGLFEARDSFWAYIRFNLLFKFIAILNLVTRGNFYFNTAIFSSMVFFGHMAFYRIFSHIYKDQKLTTLFASFCLPSLLLYTSCIHKDGIVFLSLGIISYTFYRFLSVSLQINFKHILSFILALATVFLFRNYVMVAILPAMVIAFLCKMFPIKKRFVLIVSYSIFILVFFITSFTTSFLNMPNAVVRRKSEFATLIGGKTDIKMNELQPNIQSFVSNFPQAVNHSFFRPYLWEFRQPAVLLTAIELLMYQLIILLFIFYRKKQDTTIHAFNIFGFVLVFNMMLIIGYTIPNLGAIVRYRSIFWIFIIAPLLCNINWRKLHLNANCLIG
jgi:hypothetical protein